MDFKHLESLHTHPQKHPQLGMLLQADRKGWIDLST